MCLVPCASFCIPHCHMPPHQHAHLCFCLCMLHYITLSVSVSCVTNVAEGGENRFQHFMHHERWCSVSVFHPQGHILSRFEVFTVELLKSRFSWLWCCVVLKALWSFKCGELVTQWHGVAYQKTWIFTHYVIPQVSNVLSSGVSLAYRWQWLWCKVSELSRNKIAVK
jgi:hypothetical protein